MKGTKWYSLYSGCEDTSRGRQREICIAASGSVGSLRAEWEAELTMPESIGGKGFRCDTGEEGTRGHDYVVVAAESKVGAITCPATAATLVCSVRG